MKKTGDDQDTLAPGELDVDAVLVRALRQQDLDALVHIDKQATGRSRRAYYEAKVKAALESGAVQCSLVAELDDHVVGFMLSRLYYGEFGVSEPTAMIDSIGVDSAYQRKKVGEALFRQLRMNLSALNVEHVESLVDWDRHDLVRFLARHGFKPAPRLCLRLEL
jgi:predicted N-acetyltransferase YhbS